MLKVGLTGGIGTGKSHVAKTFIELGCYVFDADKIARQVVEPGEVGFEKVVAEFSKEILAEDGTIDRAKLGQVIFSSPEKREKLNQILHPIIIDKQDSLISETINQDPNAIVIIDAALMIETGSYKRFDKLIVVYCDKESQIERVMKRNNLSRSEVESRINSQMPSDEKRKYADIEIDTSGSFKETEDKVKVVYQELKGLAKKK
ncbi:MAG: dephospho-CoA kinase [Blastocatellia bacterium]|nr:dephospho-CoA kinase [Blastocatellia bacterium]MBL8195245.1 dephospho-CoA kinase [Blastocatellia bacterium]MBN8725112.1 dephospho-CoA kinase [Acidobacteriota bacterium]